ncbi:LPD7 domain-containing protein [Bosea sp. (in: a-proteobacteria)]|uniref:LPD7 domain-containing protein n=1 Tax=Bosea sp. (in: a-proteobacteria) TaxID=1871050 RepID=UPI002735370A|nr:LPD7 domain-containing protein [Bosea sp. (in: a-proteobacteria)]MDP3411019.1 LPD7 domain-containing protein [Bosea sp. (in: a-proteobacteria)]
MQGERQDQSEFTIEHGRERDDRSSSHGASSAPQAERQAGLDLGGPDKRQTESGMPERLRRKYYVAEAGGGDEAKVYADPRAEYLAFKVSTHRMATRLEDAGVVRDMVSVVQHRGWSEVELRGSKDFRRTAWLEASVRGLSVRGYEPAPVDRAALAFRTKAEARSTKTLQTPPAREAGASETVTIDGAATRRRIDVTVMLPESRDERTHRRNHADEAAPISCNVAKEPTISLAGHAREHSSQRSTVTIELTASEADTSQRLQRDQRQARADRFRTNDRKQILGDDAVKAARSQLAAIERALAKAVRDPELRRSVLGFAKERIARELERGREFERVEVRAIQPVQSGDQKFRTTQATKDRSNQTRSEHDR